MNTREIAVEIAWLADEQKARDIAVLDVRNVCNFTDYFVVATCDSTPQLRALGHKVQRHLREKGVRPYAVAGYETTTWIVEDYGDVVLHLFSPAARDYYEFERLWNDAARVEWMTRVG